MFDPSTLMLAAALGIVATRLLPPPRRRQADPRYWSIRPPDSDKEIRVEQGITPGELACLAEQMVRNAEESTAAGDEVFTPAEFRAPGPDRIPHPGAGVKPVAKIIASRFVTAAICSAIIAAFMQLDAVTRMVTFLIRLVVETCGAIPS